MTSSSTSPVAVGSGRRGLVLQKFVDRQMPGVPSIRHQLITKLDRGGINMKFVTGVNCPSFPVRYGRGRGRHRRSRRESRESGEYGGDSDILRQLKRVSRDSRCNGLANDQTRSGGGGEFLTAGRSRNRRDLISSSEHRWAPAGRDLHPEQQWD